jgi:hypothetical protein
MGTNRSWAMKTGVFGFVASLWVTTLWTFTQAAPQGSAMAQPASSGRQPSIDYQQQVHPILGARCLTCHSAERRSGGLSLASYADVLEGGRSGAAVRPGDGDASLLLMRISGAIAPAMPMGAPPLSPAEVDVIRGWIDEGARETLTSAAARPKWEAPLELSAPPVPPAVWKAWPSPIDRLVSSYLTEQGVPEPELVGDAAFARRAYLDIWGLLPTPLELQAFVADSSPTKRSALVNRLLADNDKYAEHWISFWNDLLRNDEGVNYYSETESRKSITEWLLPALRSNTSYDAFVAKLLNPVQPQDPDGFLVGVNWRGEVSASQTPAMQAAQNTAQIFIGLNLKCNSCHDSFISKWKLKDAYGLASFFSADDRLQLYRCDVAQDQYAAPQFLFPELNRAPASAALADRRAAAAAIFTDPRNGRMPRTIVNRMWHRLLGRGIVENPDEMDGEPWSPALLDWLASDFVEHGYDMKRLIATIISSRAYQMHAVPRDGQPSRGYVFRGPEIRRLTAEQFADAVAAMTGDWNVYQPPAPATPSAAKPATNGGPAPVAQSTVPPPAAAGPPPGRYTREWRTAANSLTRALGRPIRDQVFSSRDSMATTLQALELVNGGRLTRWVSRGARSMLGELPPPPTSLFTTPINARGGRSASSSSLPTGPASFSVDVSKANRLWLIVQDANSTALDKAEAAWAQAEFVGPGGTTTPLSALKPVDESGLRMALGPIVVNGTTGPGVRVKAPSTLVYDISGRGFTRFTGIVGLENVAALTQGETLLGRFLIFDTQPDMDRLVPPTPGTPLPPPPPLRSTQQIVDWVFPYALGRSASAEERAISEAALRDPSPEGRVSAEGLADLLWSVFMKPEFQLIY